MTLYTDLQNDVTGILSYGNQMRIRYYTGSVNTTDFDDAQKLTTSGTDIYTSGLIFPISNKYGSQDSILLEQGKIENKDKKIFIRGDVETTNLMKRGLGSPSTEQYSIIPDGILAYPPFGDIVYKKLYVRFLPTGSLIGEY